MKNLLAAIMIVCVGCSSSSTESEEPSESVSTLALTGKKIPQQNCPSRKFPGGRDGCAGFQAYYNRLDLEKYYNCKFHPNAAKCWAKSVFTFKVPSTGYIFNFIKTHDSLITVYNGILLNEDQNEWKRVIRVFEHLNAFTIWPPSLARRYDDIQKDFDSLTNQDVRRIIEAIIKYRSKKQDWQPLVESLPEVADHWTLGQGQFMKAFSTQLKKDKKYSKIGK